jgi:hypothetical protein
VAAAPSVPEWAASYDAPLFQRFMAQALTSAGGQWGKSAEAAEGVTAGGRVRALRDLAETCRHMSEKKWPRAMEAYFARQASEEAAVEAFRKRGELADVRKNLRIRIVAERTAPGVSEEGPVTRPVAPGLAASLVLEGKGEVTAEMAEDWGVPVGALFAVARENHTRRKAKRESGQGFDVDVVMGPDSDTATEVLFLDHYIRREPPAGTIVIVPTQRAILFHEIVGRSALEALQTILVLGHQLYQQGPHPVLPLLFWWRRGRFALLPIEVSGDSVRFMPPVEFIQALRKIGVDLAE